MNNNSPIYRADKLNISITNTYVKDTVLTSSSFNYTQGPKYLANRKGFRLSHGIGPHVEINRVLNNVPTCRLPSIQLFRVTQN